MSLRKVDERPFWDEQGLEPSEYLASRSRNKAVPNSGHVKQILSPVIADNDGVHSVCAWDVASDHKFLSTVQTILGPRPAALASFIPTVLSFRNDAFQSLLGGAFEHCLGCGLEVFGDSDSRRLEFEHRLQEFTALDERELRKVMILTDEHVKDEIADALRLALGMLKKIKVGATGFVECNNFSIDNGVFW